jgi:uncharacterized LabA/DUF88 family protein
MAAPPDDTSMALFCDFENIALGVRDAKYEKFDIGKVLERLLLKGSIVVKKAYCDWDRYKAFKAPMHEASFELIEIPHVRQSGKNSADIRMVVDALDLCYTKSHVSTFVIISGDSDFSPLVSKLRENDKKVIGVGVKNSTSDLLIANCDEFIYYDDLVRETKKRATRSAPARRAPTADPAAPAKKAASSRRRGTGASARADRCRVCGSERSRRRTGSGRVSRRTPSARRDRHHFEHRRRAGHRARRRQDLWLDDQAGDQARPAQLQRVVLRIPLVQRDAGGRARCRHPRARAGREIGRLHRAPGGRRIGRRARKVGLKE